MATALRGHVSILMASDNSNVEGPSDEQALYETLASPSTSATDSNISVNHRTEESSQRDAEGTGPDESGDATDEQALYDGLQPFSQNSESHAGENRGAGEGSDQDGGGDVKDGSDGVEEYDDELGMYESFQNGQ